jgi:hypothetical protein
MPELGRLTVLDGDLAIAYLPQFGAPQHGERLGVRIRAGGRVVSATGVVKLITVRRGGRSYVYPRIILRGLGRSDRALLRRLIGREVLFEIVRGSATPTVVARPRARRVDLDVGDVPPEIRTLDCESKILWLLEKNGGEAEWEPAKWGSLLVCSVSTIKAVIKRLAARRKICIEEYVVRLCS